MVRMLLLFNQPVLDCQYNRPFAACHSRGTKPPCWDAKVILGQDKHRKLPFSMAVLYHVNGKLQKADYFPICNGSC